MRIFSKTFFVSFLFAVLLVYTLFSQIQHVSIREVFHNIDWRISIGAFFAYFVLILVRALRFRFLLNKKLGFFEFLNIVFVYSFLSNNLPARSGELSYVYLVKKSGRVVDGENIGSLILSRIFDLLAVSLFVVLALVLVAGNFPGRALIQRSAIVGGIGVLVLFFSVIFGVTYVSKIFELLIRLFCVDGIPFFRKLHEKVDEVVRALVLGRRRHVLFPVLLFSLLLWLIDFFFNWLLLRGSGVHISFFAATVAFSLPILVSVLPIQPLGGFGLFEGSLALGLFLFGFHKDISLAAGLIVHIQTIIFSFFFASIGYVYLLKKSFFKHTV